MFSKIFPWAFFFSWMPYPRRFLFFGLNFVLFYGSYYEQYKKSVVQYHKDQLSEIDSDFRLGEAGKELVRRRNKAREKGIGPMDPEYPNLRDVLDP